MSVDVQHLTKDKKAELEAEIERLKTFDRPQVLDRVAYARSLGDLSENAEYHAAREDQGKLETRIKQIEHVLKYAQIVKKNTDGTIGLGSKVVVQKTGDEKKTFTLVSAEEADMTIGKLSHDSPIGSALMGKNAGDDAVIETPKGRVTYQILSVD